MLQPWITGPRLANLEGLLHFQIMKPTEIWKGKDNVEALMKAEHMNVKSTISIYKSMIEKPTVDLGRYEADVLERTRYFCRSEQDTFARAN